MDCQALEKGLVFLFLWMTDTFLTLAGPSLAQYKEKGSRFLAHAYPVESEAAVKTQLTMLRKEFYDATHHCYAYLLGKDQKIFRANDDGEPHGTAGLPILNQIRAKQLTNVLIVVVRYYGGTNLGASGLVNAYKLATAAALAAAQLVDQIMTQQLQLQFDHHSMNAVMKVVKDYQLAVVDQQFDNLCTLTLQVRERHLAEVIGKLQGHAAIVTEAGPDK